ncbi:hypothetical protein [Staphylococcus hominis]|uniref:Uncharacterized protein n=1 Tax=Staphylococcus hominis TaxID=1290 RepID=A0A974KXM2_STAHO|nr:hypothetical protein [Staphylococcus hominis]PTK30793.1 hypothetical protein BUZ51_06135 [Staphylococcus hominis]RIO57497.1 hypothetical protein BUZ49_08830 [Staphylococcus hominis]
MVITRKNIQTLLKCSDIRAQKFLDFSNGDEEYLMFLLQREMFKQLNSPAIRETRHELTDKVTKNYKITKFAF